MEQSVPQVRDVTVDPNRAQVATESRNNNSKKSSLTSSYSKYLQKHMRVCVIDNSDTVDVD